MITLSVTSYNGASTAPLSAHFDETGGNIGRAENNQLVLPDPERTISRVHAQVVYRNGRYAIVDRGSNPISVNGRPLGNGKEALLQPGDEVLVGGYAMRVEASGPPAGSAVADPFADFAGLAASSPSQAPPRPAPAASFADPLAAFGAAPRPAPDAAPPAMASPPAAGGIPLDWDPFAPDAPASSATPDLARSLGQPGGSSNFGLEVGGRAEPLIPDLGSSGGGRGDSLDALFGLSAGTGHDPLAGSALNPAAAQPNMAAHADPLQSLNSMTRASASAAPDLLPELQTPFQLPPMGAASGAARSPPTPDDPAHTVVHAPAGGRPAGVRPAAARPSPSASVPHETIPETTFGLPARAGMAPRVRGPAPADVVAPADAVLSWADPSGESRTTIRPRGADAGSAAMTPLDPAAGELDLPLDFPTPLSQTAAAPRPTQAAARLGVTDAPPPPSRSMQPPAQPTSEAPSANVAPPGAFAPSGPVAAPVLPAPLPARPAGATPQGPAASSADIAALTAALREGLAVPTLPAEALVLTPALMRLMGRLVHESTRGTVELLMARAALKREIRAEVTMIASRENNPLKFSPSAEVALGHLLSPPARGFMEGDKAMRDAYDDLRSHQFAFLAGMRAALEGILKRFDPAQLEGKLTQTSILSTLLPGKRKAGMWDAFTQLYGQISAEASDDFHELFGKEFLRAYNEHIDQLDEDRP